MDDLSADLKKKIFRKYDGNCALCGCSLDERSFFLIQEEVLKKPFLSTDNFFAICQACKREKKRMTLEEYRQCVENFTKEDYHEFYFEVMERI